MREENHYLVSVFVCGKKLFTKTYFAPRKSKAKTRAKQDALKELKFYVKVHDLKH